MLVHTSSVPCEAVLWLGFSELVRDDAEAIPQNAPGNPASAEDDNQSPADETSQPASQGKQHKVGEIARRTTYPT